MWQFAKETLRNGCQGHPTEVKLDRVLEQILNLERLDRDLFKKHIV